MNDADAFRFPSDLSPQAAQAALDAAYARVPEGKLLRRTNKALRGQDIDPPLDVQYTANPIVVAARGGLGIDLGAEILIYEEFETMAACRQAFEDALWELLGARLVKALRRR